jgi:hypothetical protein
MTPKEKAKEIFGKLGKSTSKPLKNGGYKYNVDITKQCALIAVDEIIESLEINSWQNKKVIDFYKEVKQEIENL